MKSIKSFRMRMTQSRVDLFNEFFEMDEFKKINTQTKLIETVFARYKRLKAELTKKAEMLNKLVPSLE